MVTPNVCKCVSHVDQSNLCFLSKLVQYCILSIFLSSLQYMCVFVCVCLSVCVCSAQDFHFGAEMRWETWDRYRLGSCRPALYLLWYAGHNVISLTNPAILYRSAVVADGLPRLTPWQQACPIPQDGDEFASHQSNQPLHTLIFMAVILTVIHNCSAGSECQEASWLTLR